MLGLEFGSCNLRSAYSFSNKCVACLWLNPWRHVKTIVSAMKIEGMRKKRVLRTLALTFDPIPKGQLKNRPQIPWRKRERLKSWSARDVNNSNGLRLSALTFQAPLKIHEDERGEGRRVDQRGMGWHKGPMRFRYSTLIREPQEWGTRIQSWR